MMPGRGIRALKTAARDARRRHAAARMRSSPLSHRFDLALAGVVALALLLFATVGWTVARVEDARGFFDPELLTEIDDPRKLTDYRDSDQPIVDMVQHGTQAVAGRRDGTLHSYDMQTGLIADDKMPGAPALSGALSLLASGCATQDDCSTDDDLFAVTDLGGLARRRDGSWEVLVSDSLWQGKSGKPVGQDQVALWASSSDGRWILASSDDEGLGLFDQTESRWLEVAQTGRVSPPRHLIFAEGVFWLGGAGGLEVVDPRRPAERIAVSSVQGEVMDLEPAAAGGVLVLTSRACGQGSSCLAILSASNPATARLLVGEDSISPDLSNATIEHAALQNGRFVVLGDAGIHVYDPQARNWTALVDGAVDAFHAGPEGRSILFASAQSVGRIENGRIAWKAQAPDRVLQILPGPNGGPIALLRDGSVAALGTGDNRRIFPSDAAPPGLDRISAVAFWKDKLIFLRADQAVLHDPVRRRWHSHPSGLPAEVAGSSLRLLATSEALWLVDTQSGRLFEGSLTGDWPSPLLAFTERQGLPSEPAHVSADGFRLMMTDVEGQPWQLSAGEGNMPNRLTGALPPRGFRPITAAAVGPQLFFSDGDGIAIYDLAERGWSPLFAGPDAGVSDLALDAGRLIALSANGQVQSIANGQAWRYDSGSAGGASVGSAALTDAMATDGTLFLGGDGRVMSYLTDERRMGPVFEGGRGDVTILGTTDRVPPVWLSGSSLFLGEQVLSSENETVLSAGLTGAGPVYMAARRGQPYAVSLEVGRKCYFLGGRAPGGRLIDAKLLPDQRVFVATSETLAIYEPMNRRWVASGERGVSQDAQLEIMHGHLLLVDGGVMRAIRLGAIPKPDSCDPSVQDMKWSIAQQAKRITIDREGAQVLLIDRTDAVLRWNGGFSTLLHAQSEIPETSGLRRVYDQGDAFLMAAPRALWRYGLTDRQWSERPFRGGPARSAEVDVTANSTDLSGVTVWDENGNAWGGMSGPGGDIRLDPLVLPAMPRPEQDPTRILDMAMNRDLIAILGETNLEIFARDGREAESRIILPSADVGRSLEAGPGNSGLVLIDGNRDAPREIRIIEPSTISGRTALTLDRAAWRYAPRTDRAWQLTDDRLWRIDDALVLHECPILAGSDADRTCRLVTRPPFQIETEELLAVTADGDDGLVVLLPDRILGIDRENRPVEMPDSPSVTNTGRLFGFDGKPFYWAGQGEPLFQYHRGAWREIAPAVLDVFRAGGSRDLAVTTAEGLGIIKTGSGTISTPEVLGQPLRAATLRANGGLFGLDEQGNFLSANAGIRAPVRQTFVRDPVQVVAGTLPRPGLATLSVLWSKDREGRVRAEWDGPCEPLASLFRWAEKYLPQADLPNPECRHFLVTDLVLAEGEPVLTADSTGNRARLSTTRADYAIDALTGQSERVGPWRDRLQETTEDSAALRTARGRIVPIDGFGRYAPPSLTPESNNRFSIDTGASLTSGVSGGRPMPLGPFSLSWLSWNRSTKTVTIEPGLSLSPSEAIRDGRFLPDAQGRMALLGQGRFAHLNEHGLWHVEAGARLRSVVLRPMPAVVGLAHGRFLFQPGGIDAASGQTTSDTDQVQVQSGALRVVEQLRGGTLAAFYRISGRDTPAFGSRGFLFDERSGVTVLQGQVTTLTPIGLVPVGSWGEGTEVPRVPMAVDADAGSPMLQTADGWLRAGAQGWIVSKPPRHDEDLAVENGRRWLRRDGVATIEPTSPSQTWPIARNGLSFDADNLIALGADVGGPVIVTGVGTQAGASTLIALASAQRPVAPDPGATSLKSEEVSPGRSILWAETTSGEVIWDRTASLWRTPAQNEMPWISRTAASYGGFVVDFYQHQAQPSILVEDLGGGRRQAGFSWRQGDQMPFDRVRGMTAENGVLWLATELGLRRLRLSGTRYVQDGLFSGTTSQSPPLRFDRVGWPEAVPDRLLAEAGGLCFTLGLPRGTPQPCSGQDITLKRRHVVADSIWRWSKTDASVEGVYTDAGGQMLLPVPDLNGQRWPHDRLRAQTSCAGQEAEIWQQEDIIAMRRNGVPVALHAVSGADGFLCHSGTAQLGQGRTLAAGLYAGGRAAWRYAGSAWQRENLSEAVTERMAASVPWETSRLRLTLKTGSLGLEYRWQDDRWRPIAPEAGRFALDAARGLGVQRGGLQIYSAAGAYSWNPTERALDLDGLVLRTPSDRNGFEDCSVRLVEPRDGTIQSVPAESGNLAVVFCADGRAFSGDASGPRDAGAFAPVEARANAARTLIQTPIWTWQRQPEGRDAASVKITFKDEDLVLSGGRLSVDDYSGLAAPFQATLEIVTQSDGWWRQPAGNLSVEVAFRPAPEARPRLATALHHDRIDGSSGICVAGSDQIGVVEDGTSTRMNRCRDWRGSDPIWEWFVVEGGVEADGLALNGIPMKRTLDTGRFGDLFVTGAPAMATREDETIAPTRAGALVIGTRRPEGIYAASEDSFIARDTAERPILVSATGIEPLGESADLGCGALSSLPRRLSEGTDIVRVTPVAPDSVQAFLRRQDGWDQLLVPCDALEAALVWSVPVDVQSRARYRAVDPGDTGPRLLVSIHQDRVEVRDSEARGVVADRASSENPVALVTSQTARETVFASTRALFRLDNDRAIKQLASDSTELEPLTGPFVPEATISSAQPLRPKARPSSDAQPRTAAPIPEVPPAPVNPAPPPDPGPPAVTLDDVMPLALDRATLIEVQTVLRQFGYYTARIDGITGPRTISAIRQWQASEGYAETGDLTERQLAELLEAVE